jgi:predicted ATPase
MAKKQVSAPAPAPVNRPPYMLIEEIRVQGYKSLVDATLHVRPLTLLAGTNSSGKSSIMQPLLLIKQTMEAPYQPAGALVLDGAHVQAETAEELVSKIKSAPKNNLCIKASGYYKGTKSYDGNFASFEIIYGIDDVNFEVISQHGIGVADEQTRHFRVAPDSSWNEIHTQLEGNGAATFLKLKENKSEIRKVDGSLMIDVYSLNGEKVYQLKGSMYLENALINLLHVPGFRLGPQRSYAATFFQNQIKGTFDLYVAGTVSQWQEQQDAEKLAKLNDYLRRLGLTDSVTAKVKNANEVELSVSRLPAGSKGKPRKADMVNIADVGIGVSQVLPILVALIAAQEGQIVYVEQPELHLHPRAQVAMAELLAEAANRGVRVIVETHSSLLLLTVQTLIAQERIKNTDVALHWFARDAKGATQVEYVQPDEDGAYGEWPEDFGDVEMKAQGAYLDAVGERQFKRAAK